MIIWVASYPRSGNSLVMSLLWNLCGYRTSSVFDEAKDIDNEKLYNAYGYERLTYTKFAYWMLDQRPHFIKTHNACSDSLPAIYVVRDGRDVICSMAHFNITMGRTTLGFEDELHRCITNKGFSWSRRVLWWARKRALFAPTAIVKFEDLIESPISTLCGALEKLRIPIDIHGIPPKFDELHRIEPRQFRKGQVGEWKEEMSEGLQEDFWSLHWDAMKELGYE